MSRVAGAAADAGLPPVGSEGEVLQVVGGAWAPAAAPAGDLSTATGTLGLDHGGTGATTAAGAANAILPAQASNANKLLFTDGANASWSLVPLASSVSGQLPTANGGTGLSSSGSDGFVLRSNGTSWASAQLALSDTSGTLAIARGGTGATTASTARQALLPTASSGRPLVSDGVNDASFTTIDIVNATSGTLSLARGGTGATSAATARQALLPAASSGLPLVSDGVNDATFTTIALGTATSGTLATGRGGTGLTASGTAGNVLRSDGTAWQTTTLAAADVTATTAGLAGSTVQANLNDVAPRLYTRVENNTPFAIGSAPTYGTILTIPIADGTRILLDGYILLSGGTQAVPTSGVISFGGVSTITARRPTVGVPTVSGTPAVVGGTIPALAAQAVISGNDLVIQARATGGPSVTAVFYYRVEVLSTPA